MPSDLPPALRALLDVGGTLLERSSNGRVALGRAAGIVAPGRLPPPLQPLEARLARAREEASVPLPPKRVERTLRDAWGRAPARVLDELDLEAPAAVTPLAQVHRGELDGAPVAVKVRRPGLDAAVRADLALLDGLRPPLGAVVPRLDTGRLLTQIREQALDELDLEHEAAQQRAVRRALARVEGVVVPAAYGELAAAAVCVSDWLDGPSLAQQPAADPDATARALVAAHVTAARAGLILIDPRPNHVLLLPDGAVGLLGTGSAVAGDRDRLDALLALPGAVRDPDPAPFVALVRRPARTAAGPGAGRRGARPRPRGARTARRRARTARRTRGGGDRRAGARRAPRGVRAARGGIARSGRRLARARHVPARRRARPARRARGLGRAHRLTAAVSPAASAGARAPARSSRRAPRPARAPPRT